MKTVTCAMVRQGLQAFYDDELAVADQVAVGRHMEECAACSRSLDEFRQVGALVRSALRHRVVSQDSAAFVESALSRFKAEQTQSLATRARDMFADMRLVYAGLCAAAGAVVCVTVMWNVMGWMQEVSVPDSLAAIVRTLEDVERTRQAASVAATARGIAPVPTTVVGARLLLPHASGLAYAADSDADVDLASTEAKFALTGVVTRDGRVASLQLVYAETGQAVAPDAEEAVAFRNLMGAVARGRYAPASVNGLPVSVNKVWLIAHTTVHGSKVG